MIKKWRYFLVISIFLLAGLSKWMSGKARERNENSEIRCYGGDAPEGIRLVLEQMNAEMTKSKEIITAQSGRFAFIDREGNIHHYSYASKTAVQKLHDTMLLIYQ